MSHRLVLAGLLILVLGGGVRAQVKGKVAAEAAPDPRLVANGSFKLEFPKLPVDRKGEAAEVNVKLPPQYDLKHKYPLIVWLAGGEGGNTPGTAGNLVDKDKFILAGLPYPKGANAAKQANKVGDFPVIWAYHKAMLDEIHKVIPNINKDLRVLAGFSNGGHCMDGFLKMPQQPVRQYFNVFIFADGGGGEAGMYGPMAGVCAFVCWGEKPPSNKGSCQSMVQGLKSRGVLVHAVEQTGIGHAFAPEYQAQAHEWLNKVVIAGVLRQTVTKVDAMALAKPADALGALAGLEVIAAGGEYESRVKAIAEKIDAAARKELDSIEAGLAEGQPKPARQAALAKARLFVRKYAGTPMAATCAQWIEKAGG